ncbi:MAG TPA: hypothetical protein VLW06_03820, partial [Terriglobales bacterium]|nr:hypothetical protein [Terriglobales bacterium]
MSLERLPFFMPFLLVILVSFAIASESQSQIQNQELLIDANGRSGTYTIRSQDGKVDLTAGVAA